MSFLDWIANWAEEHIPLVGGWIAELVRKLQGAIEGAYDWVKEAVHWIEYSWIPYIESAIDSISYSLSYAWDKITNYLEPAISALEDGFNWLVEEVENLGRDLADFISNLPVIIYENIPDWIKEGAKKALEEIGRIWEVISSLDERITDGLDYLEDLISDEIHDIRNTISELVSDAVEELTDKVNAVYRYIDEKVDDVINTLTAKFNEFESTIRKEFSEFENWVKEKVNNTTDAILSIDDYIIRALEGFILSLIMWFIATFIDDLAHLQYDPETKQVYGKPKNPITHILIWFFEVEKPENPYKSVKDRMGVKEVRGAEYG